MFGAKNYYALVAGLREYTLETENKGFDAGGIVEDIREELSKGDRGVLELFYNWYDILNIVNIRAGRSQFSELGTLTFEELEVGLERGENMPRYMAKIVGAYRNPDDADYDNIDTTERFERALFDSYYAECAASKNGFLKEWSRFDRNLRNVIAAYTARSKDMAIANSLVGSDDIVLSLTRSSASDFGLKGELEYIDNLLSALGEQVNIIEKERIIDLIRWDKADELAEMDDFNMTVILCYLVKVNIIHRWTALDVKIGREMYEKLLSSMSAEDKIRGLNNKSIVDNKGSEQTEGDLLRSKS